MIAKHLTSCLALPVFLCAPLGAAQQAPGGGPVRVEDCNGNGIPDVVDIRRGTSLDCQGDGVPDECQLAQPLEYALDDGGFEGAVGTDQPHIAFLSRFVVEPGKELLTGVDLQWGSGVDGLPATVGIWSDPDGDGDPADAALLQSVPVVGEFGFTGTWVTVDLDEQVLGPVGTSFFVGVWGGRRRRRPTLRPSTRAPPTAPAGGSRPRRPSSPTASRAARSPSTDCSRRSAPAMGTG